MFPQSEYAPSKLFLEDSVCFLRQIEEDEEGYVSKEDVLGVLHLAEEINILMGGLK